MKSHSKTKIIGITGAFGSGKTTASQFFSNKGYKVISLSSFLEKEALRQNLTITRKNLQDLGNHLREKMGPGILAKKALERVEEEDEVVIDGIRNLAEIEEIKKYSNSIILAIVADRSVRFNRLKKLKRREKLTQDLFDSLDLRDLGVNEKITGLQTALCIALADAYIESNGTLTEFEENLNKFLEKYGK